jgi:hypothetical protein
MNHLDALFGQSNVAAWIAYAGAERAGRIADDGVVGNNNAAWQAGTLRNSNFIVGPDRKWLWLPPGDPAPAPPTV